MLKIEQLRSIGSVVHVFNQCILVVFNSLAHPYQQERGVWGENRSIRDMLQLPQVQTASQGADAVVQRCFGEELAGKDLFPLVHEYLDDGYIDYQLQRTQFGVHGMQHERMGFFGGKIQLPFTPPIVHRQIAFSTYISLEPAHRLLHEYVDAIAFV